MRDQAVGIKNNSPTENVGLVTQHTQETLCEENNSSTPRRGPPEFRLPLFNLLTKRKNTRKGRGGDVNRS